MRENDRLRLEFWPLDRLVPSPRNARTHSEAQVAEIAGSIRAFGFLGNPRNIVQAGALGRTVQTSTADTFVQNIMPIIGAIRGSGAKTLETITQALNQRGIRAPRGGQWQALSVAYVLARSKREAQPSLL